ncbi:hypothetical protein [Metalysinibacillus jejuensis]|uniref:hypothetical protein n=1 Tax=Metalysinibacillus jejuensis TaxID=914327 RepID=UPI0012904A56|nr:hypothetical protein [Metalysinibacillus jejuensis]
MGNFKPLLLRILTPIFTVVAQGITKQENSKGVALVFTGTGLTDTTEKTYKVSVEYKVDADTTIKSNEISVKVGGKRAANAVTVDAPVTTVALLGSTQVIVKAVDQYGDAFDVTPTLEANKYVSVTGSPVKVYVTEKGEITETAASNKFAGYKLTLTGNESVSTTTLTFKAGTKTTAKAFTVAALEELVDSIEIKEEETINNSNAGANKTNKVKLVATAKDAAGNAVALNPSDLTWTIKTIKDKDGNVLTWETDKYVYTKDGVKQNTTIATQVTIGKNTGELIVPENVTVEVTAEAKTSNLKSDTVVVNFSSEAPKFVEGLTVAKVWDKEKSELVDVEENTLAITIDDVDSKEFKLTFAGIDQYGEVFEDVTSFTTLATGNATIAKAENAAGTVTVKAEGKAGTTKLYVEYGGETLEINVTVTEAVANAVAAEKALDAAYTAAKAGTATKAQLELIAGKTLSAEAVLALNVLVKEKVNNSDVKTIVDGIASATVKNAIADPTHDAEKDETYEARAFYKFESDLNTTNYKTLISVKAGVANLVTITDDSNNGLHVYKDATKRVFFAEDKDSKWEIYTITPPAKPVEGTPEG